MDKKEIIKTHLELLSKALSYAIPILFSLFYAYVNGSSDIEILGQKWNKEIFGYLFIVLSPLFYINISRGLNGINTALDKSADSSELLTELRANTSLFNPYYSYGMTASGLFGMANKLILISTMFTSIVIMVIFLRESSAYQFKNLSMFSGFITGKVHYNAIKSMFAIDKKLLALNKGAIPDTFWPIILSAAFAIYIYIRH